MLSCNYLKTAAPLLRWTVGQHLPKQGISTSEVGAKLRARSAQTDIRIPKKKIIPKNAVLEALKDSVAIDWRTNSHYPMSTLDFVPTSLSSTSHILKSQESAKKAVRMIEDGSELLTKGMTWVGETKADLKTIEISSDNPIDKINNLIDETDLESLSYTYKSMLHEGAEIPIDIKEKVVAFACFNISGSPKLRSASAAKTDSFLTIIDCIRPYTKYMYSVIIRCYGLLEKEDDCIKWLDEMLQHDYFLDKVTFNTLLEKSVSASMDKLRKILIEKMNVYGVALSASTIMSLFPVDEAKNLDSEGCAALLSKYIEEINHCTNESKLEAYVAALGVAGRKIQDFAVTYALLQIIDGFDNEKVHTAEGYTNAMMGARMMGDVALANEILASATKHCNSIPVSMFSVYILLHGTLSTPEVFMENAVNYLGPVVPVDERLYKQILKICLKRSWPQLLPYIFNLFDHNLQRSKEKHVDWLICAGNLFDAADEDCVAQVKNIARLLVHGIKDSRRKPSVHFLDELASLLIKCEDRDGLNEILNIAEEFTQLKTEDRVSKWTSALQSDFNSV